ncbi:MAG: alpha/beta hydrolase [Balneolales bacterium]|nr:alpha/beta hydrolase [Balneolales bacterium]
MRNRVVKKHSGSLDSTEGNPIRYDLYTPPSDSGSLPVILFLHGFKGFKDWGTFPDAFFEIARQNFAVLAINFSHNGVGTDFDTFEHTDLFKTQTISQELADIKTVIEALKSGQIGHSAGLFDLSPVGIIGHSRGGHTAILAAAEFEEITCLVTWAPVADVLSSWPDSMINDWKTSGETIIQNSRTGQNLPIGRQLYDDVMANKDAYSALKRVSELYIPCFFIHGNADETVPHRSTEQLYLACSSYEKEKKLINGGDHTFGSSHPYTADDLPEDFADVVSLTIDWFQTNLI